MSTFDSVASYYEIMYDTAARLEKEGPFLCKQLERVDSPRVADIACGLGIHALFCAEHGAKVGAFDLSPDMIAHAQKMRPHKNITYATGDMRSVQGRPYDVVLCLGNSLTLLDSLDDVKQAFDSVSKNLSPKGVFIIQILNFAALRDARHRVEHKTRNEIDITAVKNIVPLGDKVLLTLTFSACENGHYTSTAESCHLLPLRLEGIEAIVVDTNLQIESIHGNLQEASFNPESSLDLVLVIRKQEG